MSLGAYKPSTGWVTMDEYHKCEYERDVAQYVAKSWESMCLRLQNEAKWAGLIGGFLLGALCGIAFIELLHMLFV